MRAADGLPDVPSSPLRAFVRWWPLTVAIVAGCLAVGVDAGHKAAPKYTAETRLAVGGQDLAAQAVPGFALASQQLAADYARYVSLPQDEPELRVALGARSSRVTGLSGSPVPTSNIVSIEATSADPSVAVQAASAAAAALSKAVNAASAATTSAALLQRYSDLSSQVSAASQALAQAQRALAALPSTASSAQDIFATQLVISATTKLDILQLQQTTLGDQYSEHATSTTPASNLVVIQPAVVVSNTKKSNEEKYGLAGFAVGALVGLVVATLLDRIRTRRRNRRRGSRRASGSAVGPPHEISLRDEDVVRDGDVLPDEGVVSDGDVVLDERVVRDGDVVANEGVILDDEVRSTDTVGIHNQQL